MHSVLNMFVQFSKFYTRGRVQFDSNSLALAPVYLNFEFCTALVDMINSENHLEWALTLSSKKELKPNLLNFRL